MSNFPLHSEKYGWHTHFCCEIFDWSVQGKILFYSPGEGAGTGAGAGSGAFAGAEAGARLGADAGAGV